MKTLALSVLGILAVASFTLADPEIDAYLRAAARGEAGVNPRDQTAARAGDPYAQARIQQRLANNRTQAQQNRGTITAEEAAFQRQQTELARQRELQRIELERIRREIEWQNRELERIRWEANSRRHR